ncbi:MAG: hypothetical protein M3442_01175, partial [Chloroflexota bacterium]|nr:hypothetical protein [Chloroflexota bacterium]
MPALLPDPAWADLWPAPLPGRPWSELRQAEREGRLVVDWHARWPGTPFPLSPAACPVCRPLRAWHDALDAAGHAAEADPSGRTPGPTAESIEIGFAVEEAVRPFADPAWDEADGRPVLREPTGSGGST